MDKAYLGVIATSVGVLIGFSLTLLKEMWFQRAKTQKEIYYLSIHIIAMLDRFMEGCIEVLRDEGKCDEHEWLIPQVISPKFEPLSIDVEWKAIPNNLMYEILNFPSKIAIANRIIGDVFDSANPPHFEEMFEERKYQYALLGIQAYHLASALRQKGNVPPYETKDWNPKEYMSSLKCKIELLRNSREL